MDAIPGVVGGSSNVALAFAGAAVIVVCLVALCLKCCCSDPMVDAFRTAMKDFNASLEADDAPVRVTLLPIYGRSWVANRDLSAGEVLYVERPVVIAPADDGSAAQCCSHCGALLGADAVVGGRRGAVDPSSADAKDVRACAGPCCATAPCYCAQACAEAAWTDYQSRLCAGPQSEAVGSTEALNQLIVRERETRRDNYCEVAARLVARLSQAQRARGELPLRLTSPTLVAAPEAGTPSYERWSAVSAGLMMAFPDWAVGLDQICCLFARLHTNMFCAHLGRGAGTGANVARVAGFWNICSLINHSCVPNAVWGATTVDGGRVRLVITAHSAIAAGDQILISYLDLPDDRERCALLRDKFGFECGCATCAALA